MHQRPRSVRRGYCSCLVLVLTTLLLLTHVRERHALFFGLEERDGEGIRLAELQGLAELYRRGELGDVHETRDALFDGGKRTVLVVLNDDAGHLHILLVTLGGRVPGVLLKRLYREGDLAVLDLYHLDRYLVTDSEERARIFYEAPVELAYVHQAFEALLELDEDAEVDDARHLALDHVAHLIFVDKRRLLLGLVAEPFGEDKFGLLSVSGDYTHRERMADQQHEFAEYLVLVALRHARVVLLRELRGGEEAGDALPGENKPALVRLFHCKRVGRLGDDGLLGLAPERGLARLLQRELDVAVVAGRVHDL